MNLLLAKLGRSAVIRNAPFYIPCFCGTLYMIYNTYGHNIFKKVLCSEKRPGQYDVISPALQELIRSVVQDVKPKLNGGIIGERQESSKPITIRWFPSCASDPKSIGSSMIDRGITIGVPNYYNYENREDIPDEVYKLSKLKLFKSLSKSHEKTTQDDRELDCSSCDDSDTGFFDTVILNKSSQTVQNYIDSLLLSDEAKKFSMARELLWCNTNRPIFVVVNILASCAIATCVSRLMVWGLQLQRAHVSRRILLHILSTTIGFFHFDCINTILDNIEIKTVDNETVDLGAQYKSGSVVYLNKLLSRNKALRELSQDFERIYDERGEFRRSIFRWPTISISKRLEELENSETSSES